MLGVIVSSSPFSSLLLVAPNPFFFSFFFLFFNIKKQNQAEEVARASGYEVVWDEGWTVGGGAWGSWINCTLPDDGGPVPFAASTLLSGLELDYGSSSNNPSSTHADTFFPSWGADDRLYSPYADGQVRDPAHGWVAACCDERNVKACGQVAHQGFVVASGADALNQTVVRAGAVYAPAAPFYEGRYPSASLSYNGTWFLGTYMLTTAAPPFDWVGCPFCHHQEEKKKKRRRRRRRTGRRSAEQKKKTKKKKKNIRRRRR